jgi:DNA-binding response OmpR family regulator
MDRDAAHILVVDDDAGLRELLTDYLSGHGFRVGAVSDGMAMDAYLKADAVDLIVLDLMLPGEDGLSLARRLKAAGGPPIVMLSARGEEIDRVVGLEVGADDYLPKPFGPRELLARIRAVLRRGANVAAQPAGAASEVIDFGRLRLDLRAQRLLRDGVELPLTSGDFALLRIFAEHPHRVLSRDQLMDRLKGFERDPFDRSIDVRVTRLRRKIESDPAHPVYIRTVRGEGYLFTPEAGQG